MTGIGTFTPKPGAAPWPTMVLAQAWLEARLLLRNGEQLLLAMIIPLLLLVGASLVDVVDLGPGRRIDVLVPGVMALAVLSTGFTSVAIATGFERRYGVLKRLGASPLTRPGLLAGKALALFLIEAIQLVAVVATGLALGWRPELSPTSGVFAVVLTIVAGFAFSALGLLMAGTLRAEATLAAANLVYLVLLVAGAVIVPASQYPPVWATVAQALPSGALAEGLRQVLSGGPLPWSALGIAAAWAVAGSLATARTFRWE